jgi:sugar transferase EpsL
MRTSGGKEPVKAMGDSKRLVDVLGGSLLLVIASPVMAAVAIAIRAADGSPVLFRQQRPGRDEAIFTMYKFRTMRNPRPGEDMLRTDAQRVTKVGAFLRRTSLDELPELVNVVRGEMSLVGPRPLLIEYLPRYSAKHRRRHRVRPGVTGPAQVSGRRSLTFSQRLDIDVKYVDDWSIGLDFKILLMTLAAPFKAGSDESQSLDAVDDLGLLSDG